MCGRNNEIGSINAGVSSDTVVDVTVHVEEEVAGTKQEGGASITLGCSFKKRPKLVIEWENIDLEVDVTTESGTEKKQILNGLQGKVLPGQLMALMGPSGAGKTSLLNCLSGGNSKFTGSVTLNGKPWDSSLRRIAAYVQQDDLFLPHLTPFEHLCITAKLRMDARLTDEQRMATVEQAIDLLGLTKCRDTPIGNPGISRGISGGERKRLAVASEVIMDPSIIFLDEPTSGLDSFMAESLIEQLRTLASDPARPRTIIATIHQPSSQTFSHFDQLNLIADGRNAYVGSAEGAIDYFKGLGDACCCPDRMNPADFFLSVLSPKLNEELVVLICDSFKPNVDPVALSLAAGSAGQEEEEEEVKYKSAYASRWYTQVGQLMYRSYLIKARNPVEGRFQLFQALFFATLIGFIFFQIGNEQRNVQDVNGVSFMCMMMMGMQLMVPALAVYSGDMPMYMREHKNGMYSMTALYLARNLVDTPIQMLIPVTFGTIVYWMAGLPAVLTTYTSFLLILVLQGFCASSLGMLVGCAAPSREVAQMGMPILIMPQMVFAGFMINLDSIPVAFVWAKYISFFRYCYEALMINVWQNWGSLECPASVAGQPAMCAFKTGDDVLKMLSLDKDHFARAIVVLAGIGVFFRVMGYLVLVRRASTYITADS